MPRSFALGQGAVKLIEAAVDKLFDRAKVRVLGPWSVDKRIHITAHKGSDETTLPGLYAGSAAQHGSINPDPKALKAMLSIPAAYIESQRAATKARIIQAVQSFLREAHQQGVQTDVDTVLGGQLSELWGKVTGDMHRIVDTEAQNVRNLGALDAIMMVNADAQIEDPVVYYVVVRDQHLCDECKRLHLLEDEKTPKLWRLSELGHGYHKRGDDFPALGGEHPHCRCTLVTLMPGFGFDDAGMVHYIKPGHDEIARQRELGKAEKKTVDRLRNDINAYPNRNWYVPVDSNDPQEIGGLILKVVKHPRALDAKGRSVYTIHTHDGRKLQTAETPELLRARSKNLEPKWEWRGEQIVMLGPAKLG